jgi:hypothetical protein
MDDKIKALLTELAQAASYFGKKAKEIGLNGGDISGLVFSADGYLNCDIYNKGVRYEAVRPVGTADIEYRMRFNEKLEEVEDDFPFC